MKATVFIFMTQNSRNKSLQYYWNLASWIVQVKHFIFYAEQFIFYVYYNFSNALPYFVSYFCFTRNMGWQKPWPIKTAKVETGVNYYGLLNYRASLVNYWIKGGGMIDFKFFTGPMETYLNILFILKCFSITSDAFISQI